MFKVVIVLVSLFVTLNFLLALNMETADGMLYCLNLNLSMHFRVESRNPATFKTKPYVAKVAFVRKSAILDVA